MAAGIMLAVLVRAGRDADAAAGPASDHSHQGDALVQAALGPGATGPLQVLVPHADSGRALTALHDGTVR
jgi:uncharacterized membrane protein YdfJ with MMPL/SSD domain